MPGILFDGRWLTPTRTGVGICGFNIIAAMGRTGEAFGVIANPDSCLPPLGPRGRVHTTRVRLTAHPLTEAFEQAAIPALCYRHGYGAFVSFEGRVPLFHPGIATLSYIHDLTIYTVPGSHSPKYTAFMKLNLLLSRLSATRLVTGAAAVREDMRTLLGIAPSRVVILPHADSGFSEFPSEAVPGLREPFLLGVGMTNPRKNLGVLLGAFREFRRGHPGYSLALTGNRGWIDSEILASGCDGVVNLGYVSGGQMRELYRRADALLYPSRDEGFGIPLVDAWREGCPVYCSDIPVFREVMGGYAEYFFPLTASALAGKLSAHPGKHAWAGRQPPPVAYSWDATARLLLGTIAGLKGSNGSPPSYNSA